MHAAQSWKSDCSNELTSQQVTVEKKVISKKTSYTFPSGKCNWHNRPHNQVDSARTISRGVWTSTVVCVGACVHWHDVDVTTKLCFAQLRIDTMSDHVIAASAGQRERSRSGSVISYFLKQFLIFHFFDNTMTTRYGLRARQCLRNGDGNSRKRCSRTSSKRRDVRHHSR